MKKLVIILSVLLLLSIAGNICFLVLWFPSYALSARVNDRSLVLRFPSSAFLPREKARPVKQDLSKITEKELFPLHGVVLGKTTVEELAKLGVKSPNFDCYDINGFDFWFSKKDKKTDNMYLTHSDPLPGKWMNFGMDWGLSYRQWTELLKKQGFEINISATPKVVKYRGHDSFLAKIRASRKGAYPVLVDMEFEYSSGTKEDDAGTLYSISVKRW